MTGVACRVGTSFFRFPNDGLSVIVLSNASADSEELATITARLDLDGG